MLLACSDILELVTDDSIGFEDGNSVIAELFGKSLEELEIMLEEDTGFDREDVIALSPV